MAAPSLRSGAARADAARFHGRAAELGVVAELLDPDTSSRVLLVHGPGGIGKSALLRAAGRTAEEHGYRVDRYDARTLPLELERAVDTVVAEQEAGGAEPRCIVIDELDALGSILDPLRDRLVDLLPDSARLVLAGRRAPAPSWRQDGLDAIVVDLPLRPLEPEDAAVVLGHLGVDDSRIPEIVAWAQGSPLALTVAASAPAGRAPGQGAAELEQRLTQWLVGSPITEVPREVLEVAALSRSVDVRLLRAVLPARASREGWRLLAASPVAERTGDQIALHDVLGAAIRAQLGATRRSHADELLRRIARHLTTRARLGDMGALLRLSRLLESPELRAAIGNDPSDTHFADNRFHEGELAQLGRDHGFDRGEDWPEIVAWIERWPDSVLLVRRHEGHVVMASSFVPVHLMGAADGPIAAALTSAAAGTGADPDRSFAGIVMYAAVGERDVAEAARLGTGAFMLQHGVGDMQSMLIHYPEPDRRPPVPPEIATEAPGPLGRRVALSDFRPLGAVGNVEAMILAERGLTPLPAAAAALLAEDVDPTRIAALRERLDQVFSTSAEDQRLRRAIELVHLGSRATEEECTEALSVSRRTWFRLLRTARERVLHE